MKKALEKGGRHPEEADLSPIKNAAMVSENGKIIWVGTKSRLNAFLKGYQNEFGACRLREYALKAETVLPGFIECHTHSVFAGDRHEEFELRNAGVSYQDIARRGGGILSTVNATRKASKKTLEKLLEKRVQKFIEQGVTSLEIKSGYGLDFKTERKMLEVASSVKSIDVIRTYLGLHAVPKDKTLKEYVKQVIDVDLPKLVRLQLVDRCDLFVEQGYFSQRDAEHLYRACENYGLSMTVHADQLTRQGVAGYAARRWNLNSVDHLVQVSRSDIKALAKSKVTCVLLPGADLYLDMKYPPARELIDQGCRVALATDFNPGSCPTQNLTLVGLLARLKMKMSLAEVLAAYTVNSAFALGLESRVGSLVLGKDCNFSCLNEGWKSLFYDSLGAEVKQVWRKGRKIF